MRCLRTGVQALTSGSSETLTCRSPKRNQYGIDLQRIAIETSRELWTHDASLYWTAFGRLPNVARMASRPRKPKRAGPKQRAVPKPVPNQVAVRYRAAHEHKVRDTLASLGTLEAQPSSRIVILHRTPGIPAKKVQSVLDGLQDAQMIEFATPVLRDPESNTRQVLTDEIVLRLKPGRTDRTLAAVTAAHGIIVGKRNEFEPTQYIVKVPRATGTHTIDVARALDRRDDVEFASPNFLSDIEE